MDDSVEINTSGVSEPLYENPQAVDDEHWSYDPYPNYEYAGPFIMPDKENPFDNSKAWYLITCNRRPEFWLREAGYINRGSEMFSEYIGGTILPALQARYEQNR